MVTRGLAMLRKVMDRIAIPPTCLGHGSCTIVTIEAVVSTRIILPPAWRSLLTALALAAAVAACGSDPSLVSGGDADTDDGAAGDDGSGGEPPAPPGEGIVCSIEEECVAVSSTCCECPTFAVRGDSPYASACDQVECEEPTDCPLVEAVCRGDECELLCRAVELPPKGTLDACTFGFDSDSFGCLVERCREEKPDVRYACTADESCTQVQADCCGCRLGGADTAVAVIAVDEYLESLQCTPDPSCPGPDLDVCDASLIPRCIAGTCMLAPEPGEDGGGDDGDGDGDGDGDDGPGDVTVFCGVPGLPSCPMGQVCYLNHPDSPDATLMGVGSCHVP